MARIGVFVCHCGTNIAGTVDVVQVAQAFGKRPHVFRAVDYKYMCSDPGQKTIVESIKNENLTRIVVAACSPQLHLTTFQRCIKDAGLNPYLIEMANIREQCSWVHGDRAQATEKAVELIQSALARVGRNRPLFETRIPIKKRALVIGGGISGIQAATDIALGGYEVTIVEREPSIGGRMAQFDKTFPTLDCAACILTPKMVTCAQDPNVTVHTYSEVKEVAGSIGNFTVKILKKARSVDIDKCTGCGICWLKCPKKVPSEFEQGLAARKAIYVPFPQAVPNVPVIDRQNCVFYQTGKCRVCEKLCERKAVDLDQKDQVIEETFGAIIVATGFTTFDWTKYKEYGGGRYQNVMTGLQFERMISSSGTTQGRVVRPSDGRLAKDVVFIQCVGSRDDAKGVPYCSRLCCMYTAKHALLLKEHNPDANVYVFYIDIRAAGKNYEEFIRRVQEEFGVTYFRGRVSRIFPRRDKLIVRGYDTLSGNPIQVSADLVVLATALVAQDDATNVAQMLGIPYDQNRLFTESHPKLAPVETFTRGVYLTGACQFPKDIPDTIATASAASAKVLGLFSHDQLPIEPIVAEVRREACNGCLFCKEVCPFSAIEVDEYPEPTTKLRREVARVTTGLCHGCGTCNSVCLSGAIDLVHYTEEHIYDQIEALS